MEPGRHDADDLPVHAVEPDRPAHGRRIATEPALPERVAQENDLVAAGTVVARFEGAAPLGAAAEHREEIAGDRAPDEARGFTVAGEVELRVRARAGDVHREAQLLQGHDRALGVGARQAHEPIGPGVGKRLEQDRAEEAEHRRVAADADGQGHHGHRGEARILPEHAAGEPNVLPERFEAREGPHVAALLLQGHRDCRTGGRPRDGPASPSRPAARYCSSRMARWKRSSSSRSRSSWPRRKSALQPQPGRVDPLDGGHGFRPSP